MMKALLVLQEGPGAGHAHALDPAQKPVFSVGRSSDCDIALNDHRASRHHADLSWNGRQWEVVDRGSTNGTYVNGMQVHRPYELRLGDRVTIGETTMVLREAAAAASQAARTVERPVLPALVEGAAPAAPRPARREEGQAPGYGTRGQAPAGQSTAAASMPSGPFWIVQAMVTAAVVCLASGALLPWVEITGSLSSDLQPLVQGIANLVASLSGQDSIFNVSQRIGGLQGYGKLTLAIAIVCSVALVVDIFFYRRSVVPGIVYLATGLMTAAAVGFDVLNYMQHLEKLRDLSVLFGIQLVDVVQFITQYIEFDINLMIGLYLTGAGLVLLLLGGMGRIAVGLLSRERAPARVATF